MENINQSSCNDPGYIPDSNIDEAPPFCRPQEYEESSGTIDKKPFFSSQKDVASQDMSWLEDKNINKMGQGFSALCDPQQTGHIINAQGLSPINPNVVYRYSRTLRGTDEAMQDLFRDLVVEDDAGKAHNVPIIWGTQEKAVAAILQNNVRKDESLVVDRIKLPMLAIHASDYSYNQKRFIYHKAVDYLRDYKNDWKPTFTTNEKFQKDTVFGVTRGIPIDVGYKLYAWTLYEEDMNMIFEQIVGKFSPIAYIRVRGISLEIGVALNSISSAVTFEPGDKDIRVFKYEFSMTAETFIAQPIVRKKSVLKTRIEINDSPYEEDITQVLSRLDEAVKDFK